MYWQTSMPQIMINELSNIIGKVKFELIFHFLHMVNNDEQIPAGEPGHDELFKIRTSMDLLT